MPNNWMINSDSIQFKVPVLMPPTGLYGIVSLPLHASSHLCGWKWPFIWCMLCLVYAVRLSTPKR